METCILSKENLQQMIKRLTELTKDKKYWIGIAYGRIESAEHPSHDWFRGVGTFERIVHLSISENHLDYGLQIHHFNAINHSPVEPRDSVICFGAEIIIDGNDLLYYENNRHMSPRGGTCLYMEWTLPRNKKYSR